MKVKTMLKFLLCFFIIGFSVFITNAKAALPDHVCYTCKNSEVQDGKCVNTGITVKKIQTLKTGIVLYAHCICFNCSSNNSTEIGVQDGKCVNKGTTVKKITDINGTLLYAHVGADGKVETGDTLTKSDKDPATQFFEAGKSTFEGRAKDIVNENLAPIKHIQRLIMLFGILISIIVILIYGIQWVTATSAKRQELKAGLYPLVIGIFLLGVGPTLGIEIYETLTLKFNADQGINNHANTMAGSIIDIIQTVGYIVAIIMVLVVGIQWLTGTANKRQELKGRMLNIIIGAILIAGGVTILDWIAGIVKIDMSASIETPWIVAHNSENIKV